MSARSATDKVDKTKGNNGGQEAAKEVVVVGVGAAAGGFHALEAFFSSAPLDSVAYVIVQHLSPEHRNLLMKLLSRHSILEMVEAQQDVDVEPNKVYIIPNAKELTIKNNHLHLIDKPNTARSKTINTFFRSLAADKKRHAIGIILSGIGTDGTGGALAIKKGGGMVLVQEPETAKFDTMPKSVIKAGCADFVIPPELMHREVFNFVRVAPFANELSGMANSDTETAYFQILDLVHTGILDSSPNAIVALKAVRNKDQTITDFTLDLINYKAQEVFGFPETNILGKSLRKVYAALLEQGMFERLANVVATGEMLDVEQHQLNNGQSLWVHLVAVKFDDGLVLTLQNITERKLHEQASQQQQDEIRSTAEHFRHLLEAMPHISWTNRPDGANSSFNKYWYGYSGLSEAESAEWGWKKALHPDDLDMFIANYQKALQNGSIYSTQARIRRKLDGQYRWHLVKDVPIRNEQGEITMWVGTATDIRDQKDAEEATIRLRLAQQREVLKAVLQTQETERDRISEALHNGLGQILYAAKLNLNSMNPTSPEMAEVKERVDQLINESIAATRNISFELTPSVLKEFGLKTAVEEAVSRIAHPGLKITIDIDGCDKRLDYTMELSLYRVIQELLNNILKHSQATEASIELTCEEGNNVLLSVKDNGVGIDREELKKPKGIGLHSIQNRVGLLEGKMEVVSSKSKGTMFKINIEH